MKITRKWAMPSKNTFEIEPIKSFIDKYLQQSKISVDPFSRNFQGCTYTNDLNPNTQAQYHMNALEFLKMIRDKNINPDLVVFDPPYTIHQVKEVYESIGIEFMQSDAQNVGGWYLEKNIIAEIMKPKGIFLHFGYHSNGMGFKRGFEIVEICIVAHGRCHNDTICMAEKRICQQLNLTHNPSLHQTFGAGAPQAGEF